MTASETEKTAAQTTSPIAKTDGASPNAKTEGTSPAKTNGVNEKHKEAMTHFVAGKRHLLCKDLESAVTSLALACELLVAEFGETAYECADAYYYYGKSLLELSRAESGVFGNALDGVPEGEDAENSQVEDPELMTEEERSDVEKKVGEALEENFTELEDKKERREKRAESTEEETEGEEDKEVEDEAEAEKEKGEKDEAEKEKEGEKAEDVKEGEDKEKKAEEVKEGEEAKDEEMKDEESVGGTEAEQKEGEDKKEQEAEEEEDPSNLQLAWEMLELAKISFTNKLEAAKQEDKKAIEVKVCETLLVLGEVSLESEMYEQAVTDITDCLKRFKTIHAADSRCIAETHYELGLALGHNNQFEEAVKSLEDAIASLRLRIDNLKKAKESVDEAKATDAFYTRESEIVELEALIPDIEEKIQDTQDMKKQFKSQAEEAIGFAQNGGTSSAKPISSIQVKRKAESGDSSSPQKKAHLENGGEEKKAAA